MKQKHSHYRACSADHRLVDSLVALANIEKMRLRTNFFSSLLGSVVN